MAIPKGKKRCELVLDEEAMDHLDKLLTAAGITRSGFIDALIINTVDVMGLKKIPDFKKLTVPQLFKLIGGIGQMMEGKK